MTDFLALPIVLVALTHDSIRVVRVIAKSRIDHRDGMSLYRRIWLYTIATQQVYVC